MEREHLQETRIKQKQNSYAKKSFFFKCVRANLSGLAQPQQSGSLCTSHSPRGPWILVVVLLLFAAYVRCLNIFFFLESGLRVGVERTKGSIHRHSTHGLKSEPQGGTIHQRLFYRRCQGCAPISHNKRLDLVRFRLVKEYPELRKVAVRHGCGLPKKTPPKNK